MALPTTGNLSVNDIEAELGLSGTTSLRECFTASIASGFNPTYGAKTDTNLLAFRGYSHSSPCNTTTSLNLYPSSGQATSGSGTCPSGGLESPHYFYPNTANVVSGSSTVTTDSFGCNAFNGGNLWYRVRSNGGEASAFYSVRISTTGAVTGKVACT